MCAEDPIEQHRTIQSDGHLHGVIVGCQRQDGRWLMIRRSARVAAPMKVTFPGGGMELGESQSDTAVREIFEEVGLPIQAVCQVWHSVDPGRKLTLWGWLGTLDASDGMQAVASPDEVDEVLWLSAAEIYRHNDTMPGTTDFLTALVKASALQ